MHALLRALVDGSLTGTQLPSQKLNASRRGSGGTFDTTLLAAFATNLRTPLMGSDQPSDLDILVPTDVDGDLIDWDGNDGHLNGVLHEVGKYYQRKTLFKPLFENRAVVVKGGKLAVDSVQAYKFIAGLVELLLVRGRIHMDPDAALSQGHVARLARLAAQLASIHK